MKKKLLVIVLSVSMCMSTGAVTLAAESGDVTQNQAERDARVVEQVVGADDVINNLHESKTEFATSGEYGKIIFPKVGREEVLIDGGDLDAIGMGLPSEVSETEGVLTSNGTVVYNSNKENVNVSVQALENIYDGIVVNAVRTMVTIENENAPKEYFFDFNLPAGYTMVKDTDYDEGDGLDDVNAIYILDENGEIVSIIEPAWAKDRDGKTVATHYEISGNTLKQIVEFNEDTAFPVVADPTTTKPADKFVSSKSYTYKISNSAIGIPGGAYSAGTTAAKKAMSSAMKSAIQKKVVASLGSEFIPGVNLISWITTTYALVTTVAGYNYTQVTLTVSKYLHYVYRRGWTGVEQYRLGGVKIKLLKS